MSKGKKPVKKPASAKKKPVAKAKAPAPKKAAPKLKAKPAKPVPAPAAKGAAAMAAKAKGKALKPAAKPAAATVAKTGKADKKAAAGATVAATKPGKAAAKGAMPAALKQEPAGKGKAKDYGKGKPQVEETEVEAAPPPEEPEEVVLTDAEGRRYCRVKDCDQLASVDNYCRYHYLLYWKKIQIRKKILTEGKLERYIEELTARYPDKFLDMLRKDLKSEKEFLAAIQELEIDESQGEGEFEEESETYIDEVRGMEAPAAREEEDF
jgi:hypothetical protein